MIQLTKKLQFGCKQDPFKGTPVPVRVGKMYKTYT